jgi:NDP-sugar pyrophosphorylase family protein
MDAIILAAGFGTRLRPYTESTPKPLLQVRGRPILDWALGALPASVDRVLVVVHYLAEQIESYLAQQKHFSRYVVVRQEVPRGTGDALRSCRTHLTGGGSFLVANGDDLYGAADLKELARHPAGLLVHPVNEAKKFGIAFLKEDGSLKELVEKPDLPGVQPANAGAYVFSANVFETQLQLSSRGEYEITDYVTALAQVGRVEVLPTQFWLPIGDVAAWEASQKIEIETILAGRK